jgi:hypothetical protein
MNAGMKMSKLLTMPNSDSEKIRAIIAEHVPQEKADVVLQLIANYDFLLNLRDKVIAEQREHAGGIFNIQPVAENVEDKSALKLATESLVTTPPESLEDVVDDSEESSSDSTEPAEPEELLQRGKRALVLGECKRHNLKEEEKLCPHCSRRMTKARERKATVVYAARMLVTRTEYAETVHCETCDVTRSAPMSEEASQTIGRYHYSAVANLVALRYLYGMASFRLEEYSRNVGLRISDSTQWQLFEQAASMLRTFVLFLKREAANAPVCGTDDTHLTTQALIKEIEDAQWDAVAKGKNPEGIRSGVKTNNLTVIYPHGKIVLFSSGLHHAGEVLAKTLDTRTNREALVVMMDALSANTSKLDDNRKKQVKVANCNAHVVRKFKEEAEGELEIAKRMRLADGKVSEEIDYFLRGYRRIFDNDSKAAGMTPEERQIFHEKESLPIMRDMRDRTQKLMTNRRVEPNSNLGRIYQYFIRHWEELAAFCWEPGAPLDNNLCERMLKGAIRHRKNSLFFKNQLGAAVGDVLTSILMTAKENDLNPVEYLQSLLTHREKWIKTPSDWLPWNYASTVAKLQAQQQL